MMSRTQKVRRNATVVATITAVTGLAAAIFAPAGFGRNISAAALWEDDPIIRSVPPVVSPGQNISFSVDFESQPEAPDLGDTRNVTVYSDPPGAISYSGTVTGDSAVIPAHVAVDSAPGTVTIFIQTEGSSPATATTTVTGS